MASLKKYIFDKDLNWNDLQNENGITILHAAAHDARLDILRHCLSTGANANVTDYYKRTPLHYLAHGSNSPDDFENVLDMLIEKGAKINAVEENGHNVLSIAVLRRKSRAELQLLVERWANWDSFRTHHGWSIMHLAVFAGDVEVVRYFASFGANIKALGPDEFSPHELAEYQHPPDGLKMKEILESKGANPTEDARRRSDAVHVRGLNDDTLPPQLQSVGCDWNGLETVKGETVIFLAAAEGNVDALNYFVPMGVDFDKRTKGGIPVLHYAMACCKRNVENVLHVLLDNVTDINAVDEDGDNVLYFGVVNRPRAVFRFLVERGCNWKAVNRKGQTILHLLAQSGNVEVLTYFVRELKVKAKKKDDQGKTALHYAALCKTNFTEVFYLLVEAEVDINALDKEGNSAFSVAENAGKSGLELECMIQHGAKWTSAQYGQGGCLSCVRCCIV